MEELPVEQPAIELKLKLVSFAGLPSSGGGVTNVTDRPVFSAAEDFVRALHLLKVEPVHEQNPICRGCSSCPQNRLDASHRLRFVSIPLLVQFELSRATRPLRREPSEATGRDGAAENAEGHPV